MQMVACNASGVANVSDDLPGLHLLTGGDADGRAVGVQRFQPAAAVIRMAQLDHVAIAVGVALGAAGRSCRPSCQGRWQQ